MQAAMNPLQSFLSTGAPGSGTVVDPTSGSPGNFQALLSSTNPASGQPAGADAVAQLLGKGLPLLQKLAEGLTELTALVESGDLPPELSEMIDKAVSTLTQLVALLQEGGGNGLPEGLAAKLKELPLPEVTLEAGANETLAAWANVAPPPVLLQAIQQTAQGLVSDLAKVDPTGQILPSTNMAALNAVATKLQALLRPSLPGQHPVALAPNVDAMGAGPVANTPNAPMSLVPVTQADEGAVVPSMATARADATPELVKSTGVQASAMVSATAGAIEIPKEMVQVVPQEVPGIVTAARDVLDSAPQVQAQQAARPDAPQTKFTQAVIGQMRSVNFQEGTTKVELAPRGLGSIEVEMKTNSDGSLSVVVRAENAHVLSSLREERNLLGQIIEHSGEGSVSFEEFGSGEQQQFEQEQGFGGGTADGGSAQDDPIEQQATIGNGQLDLMT